MGGWGGGGRGGGGGKKLILLFLCENYFESNIFVCLFFGCFFPCPLYYKV